MVQAIALIFNIRSISPAAYVAAFSCTKCHCQKLIFRGAHLDGLCLPREALGNDALVSPNSAQMCNWNKFANPETEIGRFLLLSA